MHGLPSSSGPLVNPADDPVVTMPDLAGEGGRAWAIVPSETAGAAVACWLVEAPWAHPAWHSYVVSLISLRPIPGLPDAVIYLFGATHEVVVQALDARAPRQCGIDNPRQFAALDPINFGAQFIAADDEAATGRVLAAVLLILEGVLSPDTDFRPHWIRLFGDNMMKG